MTANNSTALSSGAQFQATLSGVMTTRIARTISWNWKQPRPGPRSPSSGAPLYSMVRSVGGLDLVGSITAGL